MANQSRVPLCRLSSACVLVVVLLLTASCASSSDEPLTNANPASAPSIAEHSYGDHVEQFATLRLPAANDDQKVPVVVLIHGGFWSEPWDLTLMDPMADDLLARGFATWNIEFRRVGGQGGWPTTLDDVSDAIDHLAVLADDHRLDLDRVVVMGHSSGGHLALWAHSRTDATVSTSYAVGLAAVTDLAATPQAIPLLGGNPAEVPDRYLTAAPSLDPDSVQLVHGELDRIVPVAAVDNAVASGVPLSVVSGADHFAPIDPTSEAWTTIVSVLEPLLVTQT